MKIVLFAALCVFILTADALSSDAKMCVLGPGYWCSSTAAASECGATEYCRQLRLRTGQQLPTPTQPMHQQQQRQADMCDTCQQVLSTIQKALTENKTQAAIAQELKSQLCENLGPMVDACDSMVDMFLPEVLQTLSMDIQPKLMCTLLGMCNQTAAGVVAAPSAAPAHHRYSGHPVLQLMQLQLVSHQASKPMSAVGCELCRTLVGEARLLARNGGTRTEVEAMLRDTVCRLAPTAAEKKKCANAITKYAPVIFELLSTELDPSIVCQALGACAPSTPAVRAVAEAPPAAGRQSPQVAATATAGPQCLMCELVIREIEAQTGQNKSIAAIEAALERVCTVLPQTLRPECDAFVQQFTPALVHLLVSGLSPKPKRVCTSLGLCSAVVAAAPTRQLPPPARRMRNRLRSVGGRRFRQQHDLL